MLDSPDSRSARQAPMRFRSTAALGVAALLCAATAWAQDADTPSVTLDGFGTAGVVYSDEDRADFVGDLFAPDGAGYTRSWSPEVDSRLGLQLTAEPAPRVTGVLQVIAEQRYDDSYTPTVEWANLKYAFTPGFSVRVGRMVLPNFLASGYRKVGYANTWVRPPVEVYRLVPVTTTDGIDVTYRANFAGVTNTLRASYGETDADMAGGSVVEAKDGFNVANTLTRDATTLFASYSRSYIDIDALQPLFDGFRQFGPEGEAIAERYGVDDRLTELVALGVRYDPGDWFVMGELAHGESDSFIGDNRAWYLTGAVRTGAFTLYVTLARAEVLSNTSDPGVSSPAASELNAALNGLLATGADQDRVGVGVRWDFDRGMAAKLQLDYLDLHDESAGVLINQQPGFERGGSVSLLSATVDFVF